MESSSPIVIFAFNRPQHLSRLLDSLSTNAESLSSEFYFFIDGPRSESEAILVEEVTKIAKDFDSCRKSVVVRREKNWGLAKSVLAGMDEVFITHDTAIVLEDDLILSVSFLEFMNGALEKYRTDYRVGAISGYSFPIFEEGVETYFLRGASSWGWATWRNRWSDLQRDASKLLNEISSKNVTNDFDIDSSFPYTKMLKNQINGKIDSWAIRWHATNFILNRVSLYPGRTLVLNGGMDGSGTHEGGGIEERYSQNLGVMPDNPFSGFVEENKLMRAKLATFHRTNRKFKTRIRLRLNQLKSRI